MRNATEKFQTAAAILIAFQLVIWGADAMTDARALAHDLAGSIGLCSSRYQAMYHKHSPTCDRIESLCRAARNEALEEAAKILAEKAKWHRAAAQDECTDEQHDIAEGFDWKADAEEDAAAELRAKFVGDEPTLTPSREKMK